MISTDKLIERVTRDGWCATIWRTWSKYRTISAIEPTIDVLVFALSQENRDHD